MLAKRTVLVAMIMAISGAPGLVLQGSAWWQMAERSGGGFEKIAQAMFEDAPCHLCHTAQRSDPENSPEGPLPVRRLQTVQLTALISETLDAPARSENSLHSHRFLIGPDSFPGSRKERPATPPPRFGA